jgi:hypothetical protein
MAKRHVSIPMSKDKFAQLLDAWSRGGVVSMVPVGKHNDLTPLYDNGVSGQAYKRPTVRITFEVDE